MSDIKQINGKYYDFGTSNESFLKTALELKTLGIKNYYFMLRIDNPMVADIDPYKPNITRQEIQALMIEMNRNMWFYSRTVARVRTTGGIIPFELHRGLCAAMWCFERGQDHTLCEPRQTYKTTGMIAGAFTWAFQIGTRDSHFKFMGKNSDNTKDNLGHLKDNISLLPEWLQFAKYTAKDGKVKTVRQATETIRNTKAANYATYTPEASSDSKAMSIARGKSSPIILWDEFEHTPFADTILANSSPIYKTASENAASAGRPYCRSFLTTPGDLDSREGARSYPIIKSMIPWTEKVYDMDEDQLKTYKSAYIVEYNESEEKSDRAVIDIFYIEYQYYQLRKPYSWVMEHYELSGDKLAIRREILLQRLRGSTSSPIDQEDIEYLIQNMIKSDRDLLINGKWKFQLYEHGQGKIQGITKDLDEHIPYLVGIDPSAGGGGDNFAISLVNPYNLQVAAEFKNPYLGLTESVRLLITLVKDYIPKAVLIPEKNSMGIYLIQALCETSIRENLYWSESARQLEEAVEESAEDYEVKKLSIQYKKYGTYLTKKVRDAMLELLFKHVNECKSILNTEYLVDDICKLIRTSTGKIEAAKGEHDDSLFAYLHAVYVYYVGDNLPFFEIHKTDHPIMGALELDDEHHAYETTVDMDGFFSTENVTYESIVMEEASRIESEVQYLIDKNPYVYDNVYSNIRSESTNPFDDTVDIPAHFFSMFNGDTEDW